MTAALTTTAYAILGHLAMRPWSMYELAAQMRRNVHYFYPRAESQVYAEPKKLVALGLARSKTTATGKRNRTVYEITPAGRKALREWMAEPVGKGPLLEFEGLLRVFLAPFGTEKNLRSTLEAIRTEVNALASLSAMIREEYLAGRAPFQEYAPSRAMIHDFLTHFSVLVDDWAARSLDQVEAWPAMDEQARASTAVETFRRNRLGDLNARPATDGKPQSATPPSAKRPRLKRKPSGS